MWDNVPFQGNYKIFEGDLKGSRDVLRCDWSKFFFEQELWEWSHRVEDSLEALGQLPKVSQNFVVTCQVT